MRRCHFAHRPRRLAVQEFRALYQRSCQEPAKPSHATLHEICKELASLFARACRVLVVVFGGANAIQCSTLHNPAAAAPSVRYTEGDVIPRALRGLAVVGGDGPAHRLHDRSLPRCPSGPAVLGTRAGPIALTDRWSAYGFSTRFPPRIAPRQVQVEDKIYQSQAVVHDRLTSQT